jgi:hypothetical protein
LTGSRQKRSGVLYMWLIYNILFYYPPRKMQRLDAGDAGSVGLQSNLGGQEI